MLTTTLLRTTGILILLFAVAACGGPTLKVLKPTPTTLSSLDPADQEEIERIRHAQDTDEADSPQVRSFVAKAVPMSALEYVNSKYYTHTNVEENYRVGGNDVLRVDVYEEPDLSRENVPVTSDGIISLPLLGQIPVSGLTTPEIERNLEQQYVQRGVLIDPQVSVSVVEYLSQHVLVLGKVPSPGRYPLTSSIRLLDVLAEARKNAYQQKDAPDIFKVTLIRNADSFQPGLRFAVDINVRRLMSGQDLYANFPLQDNDILYVPKPDKIFVLGQVSNPGEYVLEEPERQITVVEAIGMAGGYTYKAEPNRSTIVRLLNGQQEVLRVRVGDIAEKGYDGGDIFIQPNDIILVPASYTSRNK